MLGVSIVAFLLIGGIVWHTKHSGADAAPLPTSISAKGSIDDLVTIDGVQAHGLYRSGIFQPRSSDWSINLDYTPLNGSVSVDVVGAGGQLLDFKLVKDSSPGSLSMQEGFNQPVHIDVYATSWNVTAQ